MSSHCLTAIWWLRLVGEAVYLTSISSQLAFTGEKIQGKAHCVSAVSSSCPSALCVSFVSQIRPFSDFFPPQVPPSPGPPTSLSILDPSSLQTGLPVFSSTSPILNIVIWRDSIKTKVRSCHSSSPNPLAFSVVFRIKSVLEASRDLCSQSLLTLSPSSSSSLTLLSHMGWSQVTCIPNGDGTQAYISTNKFLSFKKIFTYFYLKKQNQSDRERRRRMSFSFSWFFPHVVSLKPGCRTQKILLISGVGTGVLVFGSSPAGSWIGSRTVRTLTRAHVGCCCRRRKVSFLCHITAPCFLCPE